MNLNESVPNCAFQGTTGVEASFNDYRGKWVVVYFYPKDSTPGCTIEGRGFRDHYHEFLSLNAVILGVSRDTLASHEKFKAKQQFPFELISDASEEICQAFGALKMKKLFGKSIHGVERCTFLIDPQGQIRHVWRNVRVRGHVTDVLNTLKSLIG